MRTEPGIDLRIFVVGVPRSGTTLVQSLLAAHSSMTSFTESHFFSRHFTLVPLVGTPILTKTPTPRLGEFLAENDEEAPEAADWLEANLRTNARLPFQTRAVARRLLRVLDELALGRGKSGWIEKTPRHLRYVPFLESVSGAEPRTCFIHVIRDGVEVVASLHEASLSWERPYDLDTCVRRWNRDVRFSLGRLEAPNDRFVFYEDLTAQPEATLQRLLDGLGLPWEPDILERYARTSDRLITKDEAWKEGIGRSIRPSGTSDRALTPEQRERVSRSVCRRLYDELRQRVASKPLETAGAP